MDQMNQERSSAACAQVPAPQKQPVPQPKTPSSKVRKKGLVICIALCTVVCIAVVAVIWFFAGSGKEQMQNKQGVASLLEGFSEELGFENALSDLTEVCEQTVSGNSYYRLQQNYKGIPVYGRSVVYAADEDGNRLSITHNVQDIPEDLDLTPSITPRQATKAILKYLRETYPEQDWTEYSSVTLEKDSLCIYDRDGTAHLAYQISYGFVELVIDAHNAQVLKCNELVYAAVSLLPGSNKKLNAYDESNGQCVLIDADTGTYVFSANDATYWEPGERVKPSVLTNNVSGESKLRAGEVLDCTNEIRDFFARIGGTAPFDNLILIYDDAVGGSGLNAGASWGKANKFLGTELSEFGADKKDKYAAMITVGTVYSEYSNFYADIIAHEYTHAVTKRIVGLETDNYETGALSEALSDIFAEIYEQYTPQAREDWFNAERKICDPSSIGYPEVAGEYGTDDLFETNAGTADYAHFYSTVISHAAYKMWVGMDNVSGSAISTEDLARLWYAAMLMLPSDADFADCRSTVTLAAEHMGLTDEQKLCIATAFDEAGIPDQNAQSEYSYLVDQSFRITVYGDDNELFGNYSVTVEEQSGILESMFGNPTYFTSEEVNEHCMLELNNGVYLITLTNQADTTQTITFQIRVKKGETEELHLYTNFGNTEGEEAMLLPNEEDTAHDTTEPTAVPTVTEPDGPSGELDTSGEVSYRIIRWDRSYRTEDGQSGMDYYFDYVVLEGDSPAYQKINDAIYADAEQFMTFYSGDSVITALGGILIIGRYQAESSVIFNQDGLLCIKVYTLDAMGGNTDHVDSYSMFFSFETGEIATLVDLTGMDEATLLPELRRIAYAGLQSAYGSMLFEWAEDSVNNMMLDDFDYYVSDGQIWLHFEKYSMAPGVCGATNVPTGFYIGGDIQDAD